MIIGLVLLLSLTYLIANIVLVATRNYKSHKFYQTKSPRLPVLPNPKIFSGHLLDVIAPEKNWKIIEDLHQRYGPTFGYYMCEQPWVSTKDIDLIKLIELDTPYKHINRAFFGLPFEEFNHSLFQIDNDKWRKVRRAITPAFTNHKVRSDEVCSDVESVLVKLAASFERRMLKAQESTGNRCFVLDVRDLFERYALAVIFLITYKRPDMIDFDATHDKWTQAMAQGAREIVHPVIQASMMFPFLRPLCQFLIRFQGSGRLALKIVDYIVEATDLNREAHERHTKLQKRLSQETGARERSFADVKVHGNFRRRLVDTIIDGFIEKRVEQENFIGSLFFLLLAGFMTTADTISCLIWQLAKNPDIQAKLRQTIQEKGVDDDYMMWCINETIRYHPAVPLGTGRILGEDVTVNGQFLAKGTFVMPSTHSIHHDPSIWPEPERFNPDRWRDQANFHPAAFVGFGLGPRNCLGGKLAVQEIKLVIQMVLNNYNVEICDETPKEWRFSSPGMIYTLNDDPVKVRFSELNNKTADSR